MAPISRLHILGGNALICFTAVLVVSTTLLLFARYALDVRVGSALNVGVALVSAAFGFAVKASRTITHLRRLRGVQEPVETFLFRARILKEKLGPLLYQLPPGMERDVGLLEAFLAMLPTGLRHMLEFRNQSWFQEGVLN